MNRLIKSWTTEVRFEWYPLYRQIIIPVKIDYQKIIMIPSQNGTIFRELLANDGGAIIDRKGKASYGIEPAIQTTLRIGNESPTPGGDHPLL
jgi:hypothetical protein